MYKKNVGFIICLFSLCSFFLATCTFNIFAITDPTTDSLLVGGDIDQLLFALYRPSVADDLFSSESKQGQVINFLTNQVNVSSGLDKVKARMALAAVYTRATILRDVVYSAQNTLLPFELSRGAFTRDNAKGYTATLFSNAKSDKLSVTMSYAITTKFLLDKAGDELMQLTSTLPGGYDAIIGDMVHQSLITGLIVFYLGTIDVTNDTIADRTNELISFINNPTTATTFSFSSSSLRDAIVGNSAGTNNPVTDSRGQGTRALMLLGGFENTVKVLESKELQ